MSTVKTNNVQVGQSGTATNNFTLYQPSVPDGTVRLGVGNSGATTSDVITVSSSTVNVAATLQQSGVATSRIVLGTAQASTSGTSIDFTGIPAWVKRITVMFAGISTNGTSIVQLQIGDAGGIETTGYAAQTNTITTTPAVTAATSTTAFQLGAAAFVAASTYSGTAVFSNLTGNSWVFSSMVIRDGTASSNFGAGTKTLSDTLTQVRITTVNGTDTFDAGSINILYEG
jgi:hypothetical protein